MATGNFAFDNRCIVVTNEDFEDGNVPSHSEYLSNSLRSYQSYALDDLYSDFKYWKAVITEGYYEGACIDYCENEYSITEETGDTYYFKSVKEFIDEINEPSISKSYLRKLFSGYRKFNGELWEFLDLKVKELDKRLMEIERGKVNKALDELKETYGYKEYKVYARFSNGETMYSKIG